MSDIKVESNVVMKKINEIKPYVRNPRRNSKTIDLLCHIIPKVGFNVPLVIDENGIIVKGHARFAAAIRLGMEELPCIVTHADEEAIKADRITDNKISEFSEWVNEELLHEIDMIDLDIDFGEFGFPTPSFDDIPSFDDFQVEDSDSGEEKAELSDEEKRKIYEEFLAKQEASHAQEVQMTTQRAIEGAEQRLHNVAKKPPNYFKCVCEKCGHVMFVSESELWNPETGLIRQVNG